MIYYYYQIRDKEFRLTEDEHKFVLQQMGSGKTMIFLEEGNRMINMNHCAYLEVDRESIKDDLKEKQAKENAKLAKLPTPSDEVLEEKYKRERAKINEVRNNLKEKLGWDKNPQDVAL